MKKASILSGLLLMIALPLMAEHVDPETARKVATTFLGNNGVKTAQLVDLSKEAGFDNLYIFNASPGFVVMAADDCAKPILGYSLTGKFVAENMPENLKGWLQGYSDEIQYAIDNQAKASSEAAQMWSDLLEGKTNVAKATAVVEPLIQTQWAQGSPYNNLCPSGTVTGCVATAMAQIMYYHKCPTQGIGSHSYVHHTYGEQSVDFSETTYSWDNMTLTYNNNSTEEAKLAVATLMYHCGVSVNMDYGPSSGAQSFDIPQALINYFNYSVTANLKDRYPDDSTSIWITDLEAELEAGRPLEYYGYSSSGHAFVCDGYDNNNYFHFNWGWGGSYNNSGGVNNNGYYSIDAMTPGTHNYNYDQGAIFGIKPANCAVGSPTGFSANLASGTKNVTLAWNAVTNAVSYKIFRNGTLIGTISSDDEETFTDEGIPYGTHVYHIRSVDQNGEMSLPSEYKTISVTILAPTGFEASLSATTNTVNLLWNASEGSISYNIYCNEVLIASNVSGTSYQDTHPISGELTYSIKGVDNLGDEANTSASVSITVPYKTPIVKDLSASISAMDTVLSWTEPLWCYPETATAEVSYGDDKSYLSGYFQYYAHRYPTSLLTTNVNKSVYKVSIKVKYVGTYTVYVYTNTVNDKPDANALADTRVLKCSHGDWIDIPLSHPIPVIEDQDLWIVIKPEVEDIDYPISSFQLSAYNGDACLVGMDPEDPTDLSPYPGYNFSWYIKAYLTDGTYTYNLYDGDTKVNEVGPITTTSYTVENITDDIHQYTVKTNYYGGESEASNKVGITVGNATLSALDLDNNNKMTLTSGSVLTVGTLTNNDPANLIIEDGAQLINESTGVKATVKQNITAYTSGADGWSFIASPVTETLVASEITGLITTDTYDLYYLDEGSEKWINYKDNENHTNIDPGFDIQSKKGYLYANSANNTISFKGTLQQDGSVSLAKTNNGWNLIGNPFTCDAYASQSFYRIVNGALDANIKDNTTPIPPCTGILVKADSNGATFTFSKTAPETNTNKGNLKIALTQATTTRDGAENLDKAYVSFNEGSELSKFYLGSQNANIYIPQNNEEYAIAHSEGQGVVPVCFKAKADGEYTITVNPEEVEMSCLLLIDNITGQEVDLIATPSYTFNAKTNDYALRFKLAFSTKSNNNEAIAESFAFISDGQIIVTGIDGNAMLQVVDMTGRAITTRRDGACTVSTDGMKPGVYVLQIITENEIKTQKIIIK